MGIGIFLPDDVLQSLPQSLKDILLRELQRGLGGGDGSQPTAASSAAVSPASVGVDRKTDEIPADLSPFQAKRFLEGCGEKTKRAIRAIVGGSDREFRESSINGAFGMAAGKMGGLWAGLTKRIRTILGDRTAKLVVWTDIYDEKDEWIDATGALSEVTYMSFRKVLGIV